MIFFLWSIALSLFPAVAWAQEGEDAALATPLDFVRNFYELGLALGGLLAFGVIVYAGIQYSLAQGNPAGQSDAKDRIVQAILGLLLLFGAVTIVNIVNPAIIAGGLPGLEPISPILPPNLVVHVCQPLTSGPATPAALQTTCFASRAEDASRIARIESAGIPSRVSSVDKCKDGNAFSYGLFQINIIANERISPPACRGIFETFGTETGQGNCLRSRPGGICLEYDCKVRQGKAAQLTQCVQAITDSQTNIQVACQLYRGRGFRPWLYSARKCNIT